MTYDVVIIGAGAAGCALAYRLSADPALNVLLIEAGPDERTEAVDVPARWLETLSSPLDYAYTTVGQPDAAGRSVGVPRGRVVGGTTCLNAMIFSIPWADEFEAWGPGWTAADVMSTFRAIESHGGAGADRGHDGPVPNRPVSRPNQLCEDFVSAAVQAGHPYLSDLNAPGAQGVGWFDLSIDEGKRADAADTYVRPVIDRPNLTLWADTTATKIEIADRRAVGIRLRRAGADMTLAIAGELILSAGAIDSPALLLRSGVGPREELLAAGVAPIIDVPAVGKNLQDHPLFPVVWSSSKSVPPPENQLSESCLYLRDDARTNGQAVSIAFTHVAMSPPGAPSIPNGATAMVGLYQPMSRGRITLDPSNTSGAPLIDPGYLSDDRDVAALVGAIEIAREVAEQEALSEYGLNELLPGSNLQDPEALGHAVRQHAASFAHHCGTCAIGPDGVVDQDLRVHGTSNIRVADASVIPHMPKVAPSVLVQMIGWRAAEIVTRSLSLTP